MFMGSRLTEIVVDCQDPVAQAAFWAAVLGYHVVRTEEGQVEIAAWAQEPPDLAEQVRAAPIVPALVFVTVPEGKAVKNRLHLDIRPADGSYQAEVERLVALGARRANVGQGSQPWVVLADPEGNEFCVLGSLAASA
jgi:catechol 2,3-dioxygenase-like lactoylglutathione lyase family enzyme